MCRDYSKKTLSPDAPVKSKKYSEIRARAARARRHPWLPEILKGRGSDGSFSSCTPLACGPASESFSQGPRFFPTVKIDTKTGSSDLTK